MESTRFRQCASAITRLLPSTADRSVPRDSRGLGAERSGSATPSTASLLRSGSDCSLSDDLDLFGATRKYGHSELAL
jgi:hypothetical protein